MTHFVPHSVVDGLQYPRSEPQELTHYTTLTSVFGSVSTLPLNKMPFSFSFSTLRLDFIFLCRLAFQIVSSTFLFYTWYPQTNRQMILNGGAEESALLAACIRQDHCDLSGGKSNLVTFLTTVKNPLVTVLQHRNTKGYIYDLVWAVNKKKRVA